MKLRHAALVLSACCCVTLCAVSCAEIQAQKQAQAAQQRAQAEALADAFLANSPEGSSEQWQIDKAILQTLTPAQTEALNDAKLGLPLTSDEQKAIGSMTRDQMRAVARLAAQQEWSKQQATQMESELLQEQSIQAQQAQQAQQTRALNNAMQPQPSTTDCINTAVGISCTTESGSPSSISGIVRDLSH
jgi:hypothetical protein